MVHHEDHRGFRVNPQQRRIHAPHPHPIQQPAHPLRRPRRKAEIQRRRKPRHDLARIDPRRLERDRPRHPDLRRMVGHRLHHAWVIQQPHDHVLPPRQLERLDLALQPRIHPPQHPLHPPPKKPADARPDDPVQGSDQRQNTGNTQQPDRDFHRRDHPPSLVDHRSDAKHLLFSQILKLPHRRVAAN